MRVKIWTQGSWLNGLADYPSLGQSGTDASHESIHDLVERPPADGKVGSVSVAVALGVGEAVPSGCILCGVRAPIAALYLEPCPERHDDGVVTARGGPAHRGPHVVGVGSPPIFLEVC